MRYNDITLYYISTYIIFKYHVVYLVHDAVHLTRAWQLDSKHNISLSCSISCVIVTQGHLPPFCPECTYHFSAAVKTYLLNYFPYVIERQQCAIHLHLNNVKVNHEPIISQNIIFWVRIEPGILITETFRLLQSTITNVY